MPSYTLLVRYVLGQREPRAADERSLPHGTSAGLRQVGSLENEVEYGVCLLLVDDHIDQLDKGRRRKLATLGPDVAECGDAPAGCAMFLPSQALPSRSCHSTAAWCDPKKKSRSALC